MKTCTFIGHRDFYNACKDNLRKAIISMIEEKGVTTFYVGCNGSFDTTVIALLYELEKSYSKIKFSIVLAYPPRKKDFFLEKHKDKTVLPEGIEKSPPRFAIVWRNKWMIENSDCIIAYAKYGVGNAYNFVEMVKRKGKLIINLAE